MSASRSLNTFSICLILVSAAKPILAATPENQHADPKLIHQDRYGPIRPNDTLWSIAKLFVKKGESINTLITELEQANPKSIRTPSILLAGGYIHRQPLSETKDRLTAQPKLLAEVHAVEPQVIALLAELSEQLPTPPIPETAQLAASESRDTEQPSSSIFPYLLVLLIILGAGSFWGLRRLKHQRQQQKIEQDELDKHNALKRESIKNRLKPASD